MIACTNIQNFEEGKNCASTTSVEQTLGSDMKFVGYDMILFGSIFKFQDPPFMLVVVLINFGVKNQVPQFPFEVVAGDLMSILFYEFDDVISYGSLDIWK